MSTPKIVKRGALLALFVALSLFIAKLYAFKITGSNAIFSEAMESIVNVLASFVAYFVVVYSQKPADKQHPYGHGKAESMSAAFEGGLIAFAGVMILIQAIQALWKHEALSELDLGLIVLAGTGVVNFILGYYLKNLGENHHSSALSASGKHLLADFWTSVGVILGLTVVWVTEIYWLDSLIAIFVSVHLLMEGYRLVMGSVGELLDEENDGVLKELLDIFNTLRHSGIIQAHHVRVLRSGGYHHIDAHAVVPEFWTVEEAHDQTNDYEKNLIGKYSFSGEVHFHLDPCRQQYCGQCDIKKCPVRKSPFVKYREMTIREITSPDEPREG